MNTQVFDLCLEMPECVRKEIRKDARYLLLRLRIERICRYAIYIESVKNDSEADLALLPAELACPEEAFSLAVAHSLSPIHLCDWVEDMRRGRWINER